MYELFDTLMNLFVFAFIGLLVWLYFKKSHTDTKVEDNASRHEI
jgi:hypothetical protein